MAAEDGYALRAAMPTVEQALGYRFHDRRLLLKALTHRSFCHENNTGSGDFDELEWLGDSVLQLAISSWLFRSAKGSRRSSGQLSVTRQRFVDSGACESFALQLNLLPFLRIGQGQPVRGTKIMADCFEAVLGAVYVDAGGCSDLEPVHQILARVIPSYEHGTPSRGHRTLHKMNYHLQHQQHHHQQQQQRDLEHQPFLRRSNASASPLEPPPQDWRTAEPRKLMNLAHRLMQMAKRSATGTQGGARSQEGASSTAVFPPAEGVQQDPVEILRDFDARLRGFQQGIFRGGALSFASSACVETFGEDVARFFEAAARDPEKIGPLDSVLAGSSMLRKHFPDAPPGAERVVMGVVLVPSEVRLDCFTVVEFLLVNVLRQEAKPGQEVQRLIQSAAPSGAATMALLSSLVSESATSLLFTGRQREVISAGLERRPLAAAAPAAAAVPAPGPADHGCPRAIPSPPSQSAVGLSVGQAHGGFPPSPRRLGRGRPPPPPPGVPWRGAPGHRGGRGWERGRGRHWRRGGGRGGGGQNGGF